MIELKGVIHNGQVILPAPADLPDGTEVKILPVALDDPPTDDGPLPPEEISRLLALMDQVQPFEMSDEEHSAIDEDRQRRKDWEKTHFNEHSEKLRSMWQ